MIRIAICDDDKKDCERMLGYVREYFDARRQEAEIRTFDHPDAMIEACREYRPHIYLLDIVMPMLTGIQAARELRWDQPDAQVIFCTSESSYALESFDVNPINYLLKPVDHDKLFATLDLAVSKVKTDDDRSIGVRIKGGFCTLRIHEIMYIDYRNHVVSYHMLSGKVISTPTLRIGFAEYMEENDPGPDFIRCHESVTVNVGAIDKLTKTEITLRNDEVIPVSRGRYSEVLDRYMDYRL